VDYSKIAPSRGDPLRFDLPATCGLSPAHMASPLIFTTPIPSYHAPEDVTISAAARAFVPLTNVIQDIPSAGNLRT